MYIKTLQKLFAIMIICMSSQLSYAYPHADEYSLKLTIINKTSVPLVYTGVSGGNLGNIFKLSSYIIFPNGFSITVYGTTTGLSDLAGNLNFTDPTGNGNVLAILDPQEYHIFPHFFVMDNSRFVSFIKPHSLKIRDGSPHALIISSVTVIIQDKYYQNLPST